MVYSINNLIEAVETAKCMLMKEQIDGCKSGQATSSTFLKVNQQKFQEKGCNLQCHGGNSETRR